MIYDNIEFFNVEEINNKGNILRFKEDLILSLGCQKHNRGRFYAYRAIGCELRFVTDSKFFDLKLRSDKENSKVYIFFGDYMFNSYELKEGIVTNIHVEIPEKIYQNYDKLNKVFNSRVVRVIIGYPGYVSYIGLNTYSDRRPPKLDEIPQKTMLIYGSSISHGSEALEYINSYAFILSRMLGVNVINKSIPGSCQAEYIMSDYLSTINSDYAFIEFGVNVLSLYSTNEYKNHLDYLLDKINTKKLLYTGVFKNSHILNTDSDSYKQMILFNDYCKSLNKYHYINPDILIQDLSVLTADLLHPSDFGQMQIAINLYNEISKIIKWFKLSLIRSSKKLDLIFHLYI